MVIISCIYVLVVDKCCLRVTWRAGSTYRVPGNPTRVGLEFQAVSRSDGSRKA